MKRKTLNHLLFERFTRKCKHTEWQLVSINFVDKTAVIRRTFNGLPTEYADVDYDFCIQIRKTQESTSNEGNS